MTELVEFIAARREKLRRLRARGIQPYPHKFTVTHRISGIHGEMSACDQSEDPRELAVCGRIVSWRDHGKTTFAHLEDSTGRLQVYFRQDTLGAEKSEILKDLDIGDFVGVRGKAFRTKTGELTLKVHDCTVLSKSIRPLPEKWHGLKDSEARYRNRHLDLASNAGTRETFHMRTRVVRLIREFLDSRGYMEVETPILQPLYGGAEATPFVTRYESLNTTYYLRISDELYLKRLLMGGLDRVYEFSRDFRNEGLDRLHSPEFTLLELYEAYADYEDMMSLTEEMMRRVVESVKGGPKFVYQGRSLDFSNPWPRVRFVEALDQKLGFNCLDANIENLRGAAAAARIPDYSKHSRPKLIDKLFTSLVQEGMDGPAFIVDHPLELSPLAKENRRDPRLAERFEPVVAGMEIGNAFSELNDPDEQRKRFEAQALLKKQGDSETQALDEDFLHAMEYGMPPSGGLGIGIDRLMMILCDAASIREVILFPQLRPDSGEDKNPG